MAASAMIMANPAALLRSASRPATGLRATTARPAMPMARRAIATRASAEKEPTPTTTESQTVFYGGKSYTNEEWNAAVESGAVNANSAAASAEAKATVAALPTFGDVMAFGGSGPEIINGRLAMLGFVAALGAELSSGKSVVSQWAQEPTGIALTFILFAAASLIPLLSAKDTKGDSLGPFTPAAELLNGRAAMIGFASLLVIEGLKGSPLF